MILRVAVYLVAVLLVNLPVIVTLVTSFKSAAEIARNPGLWIEAPTLANYARVFADAGRVDMTGYLLNSLAASLTGTVLAILLAFPAAYGIARSGLGRRWLMPLVVNLRAMPLVIFAIPIYMMFQWAGLLDTRLGLGLVLAVVNLPLTLVLLLNGVEEVPFEIEEAAVMDGAGRLSRMLRVVAPLCRPAFVTAFVFGFITAWNEFLFGLILTTRDAVPVTVGASFFFASGGGGVQWGVASAVMVLAALPPVILGSVLYRYLAGSLAGAVKG
ncbi:carbohydrate ABC transporter permease [Aureimonas sp. AU4]|uniref:carbohydrate ABC transporter permease n=1 Tax=Aureimonas sp. AU4 TaxID=1638163 RepID=UPI0007842BEC|nr:carbohydrate ABC transporter permease [Aureimonas sp. AU4]